MWRWTRIRKGFLDLRDARIRIALQQFGGDDHHAALAETAERSLLFDPGLLDGVKRIFRLLGRKTFLLRPSCGQTFERSDFFVSHERERRDAGARLLAVNQNR